MIFVTVQERGETFTNILSSRKKEGNFVVAINSLGNSLIDSYINNLIYGLKFDLDARHVKLVWLVHMGCFLH